MLSNISGNYIRCLLNTPFSDLMIIVLSLFSSLSTMFSFRHFKRWTLFQLCTCLVIDKTVVYELYLYTVLQGVFRDFWESVRLHCYILPDYTSLCLYSLTSSLTRLLRQFSLELDNLLGWADRVEWYIYVSFHWLLIRLK